MRRANARSSAAAHLDNTALAEREQGFSHGGPPDIVSPHQLSFRREGFTDSMNTGTDLLFEAFDDQIGETGPFN